MLQGKTPKSPSSRFFQQVPPSFSYNGDPVRQLLLREYGAMWVARGVTVPDRLVFDSQKSTAAFQSRLRQQTADFAGLELTLQAPAMGALLTARDEAESRGISITPRGADSAARDYELTVQLWRSRVEPALDHWCSAGRITGEEANHIRGLNAPEQVEVVLRLEEEGIYFSKDLSKSIIYSVAPPGASQHLSLLAFDVTEYGDTEVCKILARHGWFQTVTSDVPHFTYLGLDEDELSDSGLKAVISGNRTFWVPDI